MSIAKILEPKYNIQFLVPSKKGDLIYYLESNHYKYFVIEDICRLYKTNILRRLYINLKITISIIRLLKQEKINIIHLNTSATRFGLLAGMITRTQVIWFIREYYNSYLIQMFHTFLARLGAKRIIANSHFTRYKLGIPKARVIHNSVRLPDSSIDKSNNANSILFIGRVSQEKGFDDLLNAMSKIACQDIYLDAIGYCSNLQYYVDKINMFGLENQVEIHGFVNDVRSYIRQAKVVVLPSKRESFGRVLLEAFAQKKPVIATNIGGVPEIVDESCGILIEPGDIDKLTEAILLIYNDANKGFELGKNGFIKLSRKFNWEKYKKQILEAHKL